MALVSLSPWPEDVQEARAAGNCIVTAVSQATNENSIRVGPVAAAIVEQYAPGDHVPQAVKNEAVLRISGWLLGTPHHAIRAGTAGPLSATYDSSRTRSALRNSGAMSLLSPFKKRGAVAL